MTNTMKRSIISIFVLVLVFCMSAVAFADDYNGQEIFNLTATYNGKTLKNGETIKVYSTSPRTVSIDTNPKYVDNTLVVGYCWDGGNWNDTTGKKSISFTLPNFANGSTHTLDMEGYIEHNKNLPEGDPERYVGNTNFVTVYFKFEETTREINLKDGSKTIAHQATIQKQPGDTLTLVGTSNIGINKIQYIWNGNSSDVKTINGESGTITVPNMAEGQKITLEAVCQSKDNNWSPSKTYYIQRPAANETVTLSLSDTGSNVKATPTVTNGTFDHYEYHWDSDVTSTQTSSTFGYPVATGKHILYVKAVTKNGVKSAEKSVTVNVAEAESLTLSLKDTGSNIKATATVTNGTLDHFQYHWDSDISSNQTSDTFGYPVATGSHTLYVRAVSKKGNMSPEKSITVNVAAPETVTVSLQDKGTYVKATPTVQNGTFDHFEYHWDNDASSNQTSDQFGYPVATGQHILYVKAVTKKGTKSAEKNITINVKEEEVTGTISASVPSGALSETQSKPTSVEPGTEITVKFNPESNFTKFEYNWDDGAFQNLPSNKKISIPNFEPGTTHKLTIRGTLKNGNIVTKIYYITIPKKTLEGQVDAKLNNKTLTNGSTTTVEGNESIDLVGSPTANIKSLVYSWDNGSEQTVNGASAKTNVVAKQGETHTLKVKAILTDNTETSSKSYKFVLSGEMEDGGELDIDPWMRENDDAEGLLVALRNRSDEDKANKNFYMIDEEVIYLVDYMNAGKDISDEVKLVLNIPLSFKIVSSDGGVVDNDKKTITWTFPNGVKEKAADTKEVRLKYTALSKKTLKSEMIYPQAVIYKKTKAMDYSAVINCIYLDEDTKFSDTHEPYMYGDLEAPTFRPDEGISRAEGAMVLLRIFGENYTNVKTITTKYSDIEDTYYVARQAITKATQLNIMSGYPDGSFKPNGKMTRAEFMRVIASYVAESADKKGLELKDTDALVIYKNTSNKNHWSNPYVTLLARLNMTNASSKEKDLRVDETITRAEVAQLCNFYLFRAPAKVTSSTNMQFTDVNRSHKLIGDIVEATRESHSYMVTSDGKEVIK